LISNLQNKKHFNYAIFETPNMVLANSATLGRHSYGREIILS